MRRNPQHGVTLIELLVAIALVGLIAAGLLTSLRLGVTAMERIKDRFADNRRALSAQRILESQINGFLLVNAQCQTGAPGPGSAAPYFQGEEQEMRFVTTYSINGASRGVAVAAAFKVIPGTEGGLRLIVNERPYAGGRSIGGECLGRSMVPGSGPMTQFAPVQPGPNSFVLADRLRFCRFLYQRTNIFRKTEEWLTRWSGNDLPTAIRVEMLPQEAQPGRIPLLTVTSPIRVNRTPGGNYVDSGDGT